MADVMKRDAAKPLLLDGMIEYVLDRGGLVGFETRAATLFESGLCTMILSADLPQLSQW